MNAKLYVLVAGSALLSVHGLAQAAASRRAPDIVASAPLQRSDGQSAGNATLRTAGDGLSLTVEATGLPAGPHGIHLHAVGKCDAPDFATAGSHLNPHGRQHGLENPAGAHLGDLPNLIVAPDGTASVTVPVSGGRDAVTSALLDGDGTALVIHATADDNKTDPSGNSGGRIACGVITKRQQ